MFNAWEGDKLNVKGSAFIVVLFVLMMVLVPWESLIAGASGQGFVDRENYVNYFNYHIPVFEYRSVETLVDYVSFEILWHKSIFWLVHDLGFSLEYVLLVISVFVVSVFSLLVVRWSGPTALIFLVNPLVIDFAFSQYRLALAISILVVAYILKSRFKWLSYLLVALSPFFHTGSIIFIFVYFSISLLPDITKSFRQDPILQFSMLVLLGALVSLAIGPLRESILGLIGDRRADYSDMSSSILYSAFWVGLLIPLGLWCRRLIIHDYYRYSIVVLSIVAVNLLHGGYSTRFLAATFPLLICSFLSLPRIPMVFVSVTFIGYSVFQWLYRLGLA